MRELTAHGSGVGVPLPRTAVGFSDLVRGHLRRKAISKPHGDVAILTGEL